MNDEAPFLVSLLNSRCLIPLGLERNEVRRVFIPGLACVFFYFIFLTFLIYLFLVCLIHSVLRGKLGRAEFSVLLNGTRAVA